MVRRIFGSITKTISEQNAMDSFCRACLSLWGKGAIMPVHYLWASVTLVVAEAIAAGLAIAAVGTAVAVCPNNNCGGEAYRPKRPLTLLQPDSPLDFWLHCLALHCKDQFRLSHHRQNGFDFAHRPLTKPDVRFSCGRQKAT